MKWLKVCLFFIPFIWSIGAIPWVNRVTPFVCGLPFLLFWEITGVFVAFFSLLAIYYIDHYLEHNC